MIGNNKKKTKNKKIEELVENLTVNIERYNCILAMLNAITKQFNLKLPEACTFVNVFDDLNFKPEVLDFYKNEIIKIQKGKV